MHKLIKERRTQSRVVRDLEYCDREDVEDIVSNIQVTRVITLSHSYSYDPSLTKDDIDLMDDSNDQYIRLIYGEVIDRLYAALALHQKGTRADVSRAIKAIITYCRTGK